LTVSDRGTSRRSNDISRQGLDLFFLYVSAMTLVLGMIAVGSVRNWILSDWLVNYEGGFIRRGLSGQAILFLSHVSHISPVLFVRGLCLCLYAVFFLSFRSLLFRSRRDFWILALVVSPAILSFQVLHAAASCRKEIIYLAAFSYFLVILKRGVVSPLAISIALTVYAAVGTLCHEATAFYLPYFFGALLLSGRSMAQAAREFAGPAVAGALASLACFYRHGNVAQASEICSSLGYKLSTVPAGLDICASGAIPYLAKTPAEASADALSKIVHYQYLWIFPAFALLALLPAVGESVVLYKSGMRRETRILWTTAAVAWLGTAVLFRYTIDWGRWIYIHAASIALLVIFMAGSRASDARGVTRDRPVLSRGRRLTYALLLLIYATCWNLPSDTETLRMGYAGRVLDALHITTKANHAERIPSN